VVKQAGYEANHRPLPIAKANSEHSDTSIPPYAFMTHTRTTSVYMEKDRTAKAVDRVSSCNNL
jgi:hypothetical protein